MSLVTLLLRRSLPLVLLLIGCGAFSVACSESAPTEGDAGGTSQGADGGTASGAQGAGASTSSSGGLSSGGASAGTGAESASGAQGGGGAQAGAGGNGGTVGQGGSGGEATTGGQSSTGGTRSSGGGFASTGGTSSGGSGSPPSGETVSIDGRQLLLDGVPFRIRGVNWNPVPKGGVHPADLDFEGFVEQDVALMKAAGINAVRTYERVESSAVLDRLHEAGIYVFSTVYGWWQDDLSVVTARVNAVKDHPAILAWVLGNEWNYNQLYADGQITTEQARDQINQAAALIKAADPIHPVVTIYGELGGLSEMVVSMPDIDLWGINSYRGISHGDLFTAYAAISDKPMFLGEYGADAFNADSGMVDLVAQAEATRELTEEIIENYVTQSAGVTIGGFIFEFADEWWKDGAGSPDVQDVGGIAPGGGPHPDQTFNEEYWGIVDIDRTPRPAYDELKALYAP